MITIADILKYNSLVVIDNDDKVFRLDTVTIDYSSKTFELHIKAGFGQSRIITHENAHQYTIVPCGKKPKTTVFSKLFHVKP